MALPTASDNVFPKLILEEGAAPATPASGQVKVYAKTDGLLYSKDDAGTETGPFGGSGVADIVDIPTAETDDTLVLAPDGAGGVEFRAEAGGGGGGITQAYVGYNTVGGSWEATPAHRTYMKQVTLASNALLSSVDLYIKGNNSNAWSLGAGVMADNAGAPDIAIAGVNWQSSHAYLTTTGRWLSLPVGIWLTAGTYWLWFQTNSTACSIAYDGSGADRYGGGPAPYLTDAALLGTITTTSNKYSIRGNTIS